MPLAAAVALLEKPWIMLSRLCVYTFCVRYTQRVWDREREMYIIEPLISYRSPLFTLNMMTWLDSKMPCIFQAWHTRWIVTRSTPKPDANSLRFTARNSIYTKLLHIKCTAQVHRHTHTYQQEIAACTSSEMTLTVCSFSICHGKRKSLKKMQCNSKWTAVDDQRRERSEWKTRAQNIFRFKLTGWIQ